MLLMMIKRLVAKMLRHATFRFTAATRYLLGLPPVDLPHGKQQLLSTKSVDDTVRRELAAEWTAVLEENKWETGGQNLLDETDKLSREDAFGSATEDELIELSDGEEGPALVSLLDPSRFTRLVST
ncbi:unnamed protein product [Hyaloperonospora brassicae]|uniref:RxLR effector candidate protein n=1 Tax=Hyaloperonospora brassicae TaxID=162125 RepID=A0AAV0TRH5_HYABA|nr:unnamed protein product [Hyaloperonospora brassicae]